MEFLSERSQNQERLDNLHLSGPVLDQTLEQLGRINLYLGNTYFIIRTLFSTIKNHQLKEVSIVDLGCGGGDILRSIEKKLSKSKISYRLVGIDGNPNALEFAKKKAGNGSQISFLHQNILEKGFELNPCDFLISSHFIYHFEEDQLLNFLQKHKNIVRYSFIFSELRRNQMAKLLFRIFSRIAGFNDMVRSDGLTAINRAYTYQEIKSLLTNTDFKSIVLKKVFPFRMLITLYPSSDELDIRV